MPRNKKKSNKSQPKGVQQQQQQQQQQRQQQQQQQQTEQKRQMIEKYRDAAESIIEATLQSKEKELAAAEKAVAILNEQWHAGTLDITQGTFESEIEQLERRIAALKGDTVVIRTTRHELSGRMLDDRIWRQDREIADWAYLDLLISHYKTPEGARLSLFASRDDDAQSRFHQKVLKAYGAEKNKKTCCVISGQWHLSRHVKAAHIVRYNVGEPSARHLFGPSGDKDGHLMGVKNGIPIHEEYEEALDDARLIIVPDGDPDKGCWKLYWLYEEDAQDDTSPIPLGHELHGRSLQFRTEFRPAARYLYFAYCMSILRWQRHDVPGWWKDHLVGEAKFWATPGSYLRTSMLRRIAHQIGHLTKEEAAIFAAEKGSGRIIELADEEEEDEDMDSIHSSVIGSACSKQTSPTPATSKASPER